MKCKLGVLFLICMNVCGIRYASCQESTHQTIEIVVFDATTKLPIDGVHAFFTNSTFGSVSARNGAIELIRPQDLQQELIFTHVGYETQILSFHKYFQLERGDSVLMVPHGIDLDLVVVEGSRNRVWKKRYKRFKKAFLGVDKSASKCEITNPESLQFEEKDGELIAKSTELINIENRYLGYNINFHLENFTLSKDGSLVYRGQARFKEMYERVPKKIGRNRVKAFERSSKYFYQALINDKLTNDGLSMSLVRYHGGKFIEVLKPSREEMIKRDTLSGNYFLSFSDFLQVTNKNIKDIIYTDVPGVSSGLESRRFNSPRGGESGKRVPATSQLYKVSEYIVLDKYGNVLNPESVREYGFWADERMSTMLPFDYGWQRKESKKQHDSDIVKEQGQDEKQMLLDLIYADRNKKSMSLEYIRANWEPSFFPPLLDLLRMTSDEWLSNELLAILQNKAGKQNIPNYFEGLMWLWSQDKMYDEAYMMYKSEIYRHVDPSFAKYFDKHNGTEMIRLDEVVWGGVKRDGIPPLNTPKMIPADKAQYLNGSDIVFGIYINGEAKAYPKRILAWHEFFQDKIGGLDIAGVYCTLCGTVIAYDRAVGDEYFDLGTSGFLYRSNKLMYDKATYSLWSTIEGRPVIGQLAERNITLKTHPVVTTTWGRWREQHPDTKVLDLNTGFDRNYDEGVAYKEYFESDALMFPVPLQDHRLQNKQEVMVVRVPGYQKDPVAFSVDHLKRGKVLNETINGHNVVIFIDQDEIIRAYNRGNIEFKSFKKGIAHDINKEEWIVNENEIKNKKYGRLDRLPSHNIFWFAWLNAYPGTRLIK